MSNTVADAALWPSATKYTRTFNFREIFKCAFKIYGRWRIDTHFRNTVPLVWGSLRLTPIITDSKLAISNLMLLVTDNAIN